MTPISELDTVRIVAMHGTPESHVVLNDSLRPPAIGDVGTVVSVFAKSDLGNPNTRFTVESYDADGFLWLADFSREELDLVERH